MAKQIKSYFKSPMNYQGGKYKLLPQILPLFPDNIDTFVDLFAGGLDVSLNVKASNRICNDIEEHIIDFYRNVQVLQGVEVDKAVRGVVAKYGLDRKNKDGYISLRTDYNKSNTWQAFYALLAHSFSHQIRYNSKGEFNIPFGKDRSCYNQQLQERLIEFVDRLDDTFKFSTQDFKAFDFTELSGTDLVYADPPYLITTASYNESGGWTEKDERILLATLDALHRDGIRFALSNVMQQGCKTNEILLAWSTKYTVHNLNFNYKNSAYCKKDENKVNVAEVLITNF